jgi:carboxyl-terminal processing protease
MNITKVRNVFLILALVAVSSLVGYRLGERNGVIGVNKSTGNQLDLSMMWQVKSRLEQLFLEKDKINDKQMEYGAIGGMVASLGDPYTVYLPPTDNKSANEDLAGEFGGVGISLGYKDKNLAVMSPLAKTPAEKAGILAGDLILKITDKIKNIDKETSGISLTEAVELIRGKIGTEVTLKMFREGKTGTFDITLKRENIVVPSIELEWKQKDGKEIAWIKLYKFTDRLYTEWTEVVDKINKEKAGGKVAGIILDVRNNPGGFLQASVMVASDFLKDGVVVSQESSDGKKEDYPVDKTLGRLLNDKLVVLVNGGSASASEILAGALKEYKRANLVGEKTFGKGTVQQPEDFPDGSGLHVTIARWLLPNGVNIHKVGVEPDVTVVYEPPVLPTGTPAASATKSSVEPKDNQLDKAIEVLLKE